MGTLGANYASGEGVAKDVTVAAQWFQKGADRGDVSCQMQLGLAYAQGEGVAQNFVAAYKWLTLAGNGEPSGAFRGILTHAVQQVAARMTAEEIAATDAEIKAWRPIAGPPAS